MVWAPADEVREISVDFARHGANTTALRYLSAFWNARLQGYDRWLREAKNHPARFSAKVFGAITLPSLLEYAANRNDPDYHRQPQWQRDLFWMFKVGETWVKVPKPFELGLVFGTLPVRMIEWIDRQDPVAFDRFVQESLLPEAEAFVPAPTVMMPLIENVVNYSFFMDRPIVPRGMQGVEPRYQSREGTSEVARLLGEQFGVSPMKLDNLLYAWTGGLGRLGSQVADIPTRALEDRPSRAERPLPQRIPGIRGMVASEPGFNSEPIERFYREYSRAQKAVSTLRFLERENRPDDLDEERNNEEARRYRDLEPALRKVAAEINDLRAQARETERRPDDLLSPQEKADRIRELGRRAMELAEQELERLSSRRAPPTS